MARYYQRSEYPEPSPKKASMFRIAPQDTYPVVLYTLMCITMLYYPFESVGSLAILHICNLASDPKAAKLAALVLVALYKFSMFWSMLLIVKLKPF